MPFSRVLRSFLLGYAVLHITVAAVFLFVLTQWLRETMIEQTRQRLLSMAYVLRENIRGLEGGLWDERALAHIQAAGAETDARFTLVTWNGSVVADSRTGREDIGDHGSRPEVQQAMSSGVGFHERSSATLGISMMYLAVPLYELPETSASETSVESENRQNGIIRVAMESESIREATRSLQSFVWIFSLNLGALTGGLMIVFAAREMRPLQAFSKAAHQIAAGEYASVPLITMRDNEWRSLAEAFAIMQTELASREQRLTENSLQLEAVLASMIEGVLAVDDKGLCVLANRAACEMLDLAESELVGCKLFDVVRIPEFIDTVSEVTGGRPSAQTEFQTLGATRRTLSMRVTSLSSQLRPGAAAVLQDVTALRHLETMRQDFVANVSHELKTPLSSIKAYTETLRLGAIEDPENNIEFVRQIESQAELLERQIEDLLQLSRVETGEAAFDIKPLPVQQAFQECQKRFRAEAERRQVQIQIEEANSNLMLLADPEAFRTILDNLVSNGIRYTKSGGRVHMSARPTEGQIEILVSDSGIGIASEHHSRVFERFYRVDKARSRDVGGTGLGLAVVKHTVQAMQGTIFLESQVGKGSRFFVRLPAPTQPR